MEIEKNELLRYLGWKGQVVDEALQTKLDDAAKRCLAIAEPRSVVMRFPLHGGCMLGDTGIALAGDDIKRHLAGCRRRRSAPPRSGSFGGFRPRAQRKPFCSTPPPPAP